MVEGSSREKAPGITVFQSDCWQLADSSLW
jgi:hypothetical protein